MRHREIKEGGCACVCKMSRERVSGVGGEKLRWYGIWRYIVIVPFAVYI